MVWEYFLWLSNIEARLANFWWAFCHNSVVGDVISSSHVFTVSFTMKRQQASFSFLSVGNDRKSRMETVTGKAQVFDL